MVIQSHAFFILENAIFKKLNPSVLAKKSDQHEDKKNNLEKVPILVVGDSPTTENFIRFSKQDDNSLYEVVGIISFKESSIGRRIHNIPILGSTNKLESINENLKKI